MSNINQYIQRKHIVEISDKFEQLSNTKVAKTAEYAGSSTPPVDKIPSNDEISKRFRNEINPKHLDAGDIRSAADVANSAVSSVLRDQISEIENALEVGDRGHVERLSTIIVTRVVTQLDDKLPTVMAESSDEIVRSVVDVVTNILPQLNNSTV